MVTHSELITSAVLIVMLPFHLWRIIVGPVCCPVLVRFFLFFREFTGIMLMLYTCEYALILYFSVVVWKIVPSLVDDFYSSLLRSQNVTVAFMMCLVNTYQQNAAVSEARFLGLPSELLVKTQFRFRYRIYHNNDRKVK